MLVGRSGGSSEYYYSRASGEMKSDHASSRNYDGEQEQMRDNCRRSVMDTDTFHFLW